MTTLVYTTITIAHLGRRTAIYCRLCRDQIGHYADTADAKAEGELHVRKYHQGGHAA